MLHVLKFPGHSQASGNPVREEAKMSWASQCLNCKRSVNVAKPFTRDFIFGCPAGRPPKMSRFYVTKKCNAQKSIFPKWSIIDSDRPKTAPNDPQSHFTYISRRFWSKTSKKNPKSKKLIFQRYIALHPVSGRPTGQPPRMSRFCVTLKNRFFQNDR